MKRHAIDRRRCRFVLLAAAFASSVAIAHAGTSASQSYTDTVSLPADADGLRWQLISSPIISSERVLEMVPVGQSAADWSRIITVKTMAGGDPIQIVNGTVDLLHTVCGRINVVLVRHHQALGTLGGSPQGPGRRQPQSPGRIRVAIPVIGIDEVLLTCRDPDVAKLPGRTPVPLRPIEITWYTVMRCDGRNDIVQRSWHGSDAGSSVLGSGITLDAWKRWITAVTIRRNPREPGAATPRMTSPI